MSDPTDPIAWAHRTEEDYALAQLSAEQEPPLTYGCVFHAQQCAEKYLKALLVARNQRFPRTHDLAALSDLCEQNEILLPVDQDALQKLSAYAVQIRYPGDEPTRTEATDALQTAGAVRQYARQFLGYGSDAGGAGQE